MNRCTVSGNEPANPADAPVPNSTTLPDGQHVDHWVMCPGEIIKAGFKRPVRDSYQHVGTPGPEFPLIDLTAAQCDRLGGGHDYVKYEPYPEGHRGSALGRYWSDLDKVGKGCGVVTSIPQVIAETYAANPGYYGTTFCCGCGKYLPVGSSGEFVWKDTNDRVGT